MVCSRRSASSRLAWIAGRSSGVGTFERGFEPQPQAGERRAQLVRGVGGERPFPGQQVVEPGGGRVQRRAHRVDLRDPLRAGPHAEVAVTEPARRRREVFERHGEPPGLPTRDQPGRSDHEDGERGHRPPRHRDLLDHLGLRPRGAYGTDHVRVVGDRDDHHEVVTGLVDGVLAPQRLGDRRPASGRPVARDAVEVVVVHRDPRRTGPVAVVDRVLAQDVRRDRDRDRVGVALEVGALGGEHVPPHADRERDAEQRDGQHGDPHRQADDPRPHAPPPVRGTRRARRVPLQHDCRSDGSGAEPGDFAIR